MKIFITEQIIPKLNNNGDVVKKTKDIHMQDKTI
jgi:hypothetical protein